MVQKAVYSKVAHQIFSTTIVIVYERIAAVKYYINNVGYLDEKGGVVTKDLSIC